MLSSAVAPISYGETGVVNRGNQRAVVFHDDWHYQKFLEKLGRFSAEFEVAVFSYCCMANHFHLLVRSGAVVIIDHFIEAEPFVHCRD